MSLITDLVVKQLSTIGQPKVTTQTTTATQPTNYANLALLAAMMLESYYSQKKTGALSTEMVMPEMNPITGILPESTPAPTTTPNAVGSFTNIGSMNMGQMNPSQLLSLFLSLAGAGR
jgi:hypothetical protein